MSTTTYSTGTVSVGAGSTSVTGVGTSWLTGGIRAGDRLVLAGLTARIATVNSNTSITLARGWPGGAQSAADYDIWLVDDPPRSLVAANSLLQALGAGTLTSLGALEGAANLMPYWTGAGVMNTTALTAAARTLLDDADVAAMRATLELVKTTSSTDATAGRMMKVGDFGLGASTPPGAADLNTLAQTGVYSADSATANRPGGLGNWLVLHMARTSSLAAQLAISRNATDPMYRRAQVSAGVSTEWSRVYDQGSILGTVSQSGGVPTGAVIERGSNANGSYVRFADGTQICHHAFTMTDVATATGQIFRSAAEVTWTYPAAFLAAAPPITGAQPRTPSDVWGRSRTASGTAALVRLYSSASLSGSVTTEVFAIGRWF